MRQEIDLLAQYPKTKRDFALRGPFSGFGHDFFDGDRKYGYGGYYYDPKFFRPVVPAIRDHFKLTSGMSVLDVGCAKGFLMHDLRDMIPGLKVSGVDISDYAIGAALDDMKPYIQNANAVSLPFSDESFDIVLSINTVHNLPRLECAEALREIRRVCKHGSFITVDAWRNDEEKERMLAWNLTAKTLMSIDEWKAFFDLHYAGDYYWFTP